MYLKINGEDIKYNVSIQPFTTTHGYSAIRFVGEDVPETDKGFKYFTDDDKLFSDFSEYTHMYRDNEYSVEYDEPFSGDGGEPTPIPPSAVDRLNVRVSQLNSKVNQITPYTETKTAYYGEKEKTFYNVPNGNVTVFFSNYTGDYSVSRVSDNMTVAFNALAEQTDITINIQ